MTVDESSKQIQQACSYLKNNQVVAIPTETVYGLAADATSDLGVAAIFALKNRPHFNPLIIHVSSIDQAEQIAVFSEKALAVAKTFWPGPLTLVLQRRLESSISLLASAGLETIAIRVPAHPIAQKLLKAYGRPLAAPSANRSTHISSTCVDDVLESFGSNAPFVINGGACRVGIESTILDLSEDSPVLLRPGGISLEDLESVIGKVKKNQESTCVKAPGMMKRHYAPLRPLRMNAVTPEATEAFLGFGPECENAHLNLSPSGCLTEAAAHLFRMMRDLDCDPFSGIAVAPIPLYGLGLAINDRLTRASCLLEIEQ